MCSEDISSLHDVYSDIEDNEKCQRTNYVLQFLWRYLTSKFDVIGPFFTCSSSIDTAYLHSVLAKVMLSFHQYGFRIRALVCDGASSNLSLLKLMCGFTPDRMGTESCTEPWFKSPYDGNNVFLVICPSHQVNNSVYVYPATQFLFS